ncbi:Uncharacterized membrane protein [bacterium A37T11]|nr:Uncharacterized membrane protein [bacterium A37T11]
MHPKTFSSPTVKKWSRTLARILLGSVLVFAGISHLLFKRKEFQNQVPDWLPLKKDYVVVVSGYVEILMGLALLFAREKRVEIGRIAALFFMMVFPGNLSQFLHQRNAFGLDSDSKRLARLWFQPILVFWALWSTTKMEKTR